MSLMVFANYLYETLKDAREQYENSIRLFRAVFV